MGNKILDDTVDEIDSLKLSGIELDELTEEEENGDVLPDSDSIYGHYKGINLNAPSFEDHIMRLDEVKRLFSNDVIYNALFAYPYLPADGFEKSPIFTTKVLNPKKDKNKQKDKKPKAKEENHLKIFSYITVNQEPKSEEAKYAQFALPKSFWMRDKFTFFKDEGKGRFHVTTVESSHFMTKLLLSAKNRPGLFFKIKRETDALFYEDIAIYFPAQTKSKLQNKVVHSGQAFVLVKEDIALTAEMTKDIIKTFNALINDSYNELGGLYHVDSHQPIERYLENLPGASQSLPEEDITQTSVTLSL